ncbi:cellulose biosynthesis protein BcsG [Pseudoalteromonas sp. JB197]|uniref:cellulose biosynthesis protein BcsG n=1 Tax=Pseudoalteromonas sp. JB197 TaxID=1434839 RepID=UPI00097F36F9|nr:cellulose biosynthesis protein BcsG [Pseudoalteromonas sp. JB197]PCC12328.1 cellulose biosynthesis protein BcsG [Pseudoalteromonas sp. JB197]SJN48454.1 predicted inner membrane protein [Pseudoalteromonas sp. JB197]
MKLSGLGIWNLYFLVKFVLFYYGAIKFDFLSNAALAALFALTFSNSQVDKLKHFIGAVFAIVLLYKDSWLPPIDRLNKQAGNIQDFSLGYFVELFGRIVNYDMLLGLFIIVICFWYTSQWIRFTTVTIAGLIFIGYQGALKPNDMAVSVQNAPNQEQEFSNTAVVTQKLDSADQQLNDFYKQQSQLVSYFPDEYNGTQFDVVVLNICSLAIADLNAIGVSLDDVYSDFDIVFSDFNSATSYSGPAAIRLLRASCGQTSQPALFDDAPEQCHLFNNLEKLGYDSHLVMNHDGHFDGFKDLVKKQGKLNSPLFDTTSLPVAQYSFDSKPIYSDEAVLNSWLEEQGDSCAPCAMYYNTISLHDGNQLANSRRMNSDESYPVRQQNLFSDINQFIKNLEKRGRNVMLMLVPEHGAALQGDKVQFAGLREIPSPSIVTVPAAIKFIGPDLPRMSQITVANTSSYFALSELITKVMKSNYFAGKSNNMAELVSQLPTSQKVAENAGTIMMYVNKRPYIQLDGGEWTLYPRG